MTGPASGSRRSGRPGLGSLPSADRIRALLREHRIFVLVLIPALGLRLCAELGYQWQAWFNDSFVYMSDVVGFHPDTTRVSGYAVFLKILEPLHSYAVVTILQHLMGAAVGVMVYALARHRFGAPAWVASLAAVPVLYDAFQIQLEHLILSDVPFLFLITLAATIVLWVRRPSWKRVTLAAFIIGVADTVRSVGLPLLAILVVYVILQRIGWRAAVGSIVACITPVLLYSAWFFVDNHQFSLTGTYSDGVFLYARVMTFAECSKMHVPTEELALCTTTPPAQRPIDQEYVWSNFTPLDRFPPTKFSQVPNQLAQNFAVRAIEAQPLSYLHAVADDTFRVFTWKRTVFPNAATYNEYLFSARPLGVPSWARGHVGGYSSDVAFYVRGNPLTHVVEPFAGIMRVYQRHIYLPGTLLGVILIIGLGGVVLAWRRIGGPALLPWAISVGLLVIPAATAEFDYRYVLPAVPFACLAAAMAFGKDTAARNWLDARQARPALAGGAPAQVTVRDSGDMAEPSPAGAAGPAGPPAANGDHGQPAQNGRNGQGGQSGQELERDETTAS
ncbi:MAG TPA: phospholipid carrier-dependent glycosyltransferase [Streptosporangiaceae bacterium]